MNVAAKSSTGKRTQGLSKPQLKAYGKDITRLCTKAIGSKPLSDLSKFPIFKEIVELRKETEGPLYPFYSIEVLEPSSFTVAKNRLTTLYTYFGLDISDSKAMALLKEKPLIESIMKSNGEGKGTTKDSMFGWFKERDWLNSKGTPNGHWKNSSGHPDLGAQTDAVTYLAELLEKGVLELNAKDFQGHYLSGLLSIYKNSRDTLLITLGLATGSQVENRPKAKHGSQTSSQDFKLPPLNSISEPVRWNRKKKTNV